jgi:serine/threonine-protein kinase
VKVLDFGISKTTPAAGSMSEPAMTQTATSLGTPLYMSPEQMMSAHDVDARTDVWALGTILYELLAGVPPFRADTLQALGVLIATRDPSPIKERRSDLPAGIEAAILRCLAKAPSARFADVAEFARALTPFAPEHARTSIERAWRILHPAAGAFVRTPSGSSSNPSMPVTTLAYETGAGWGRTSPATTRRRKTLMAAGAATAVLVAIAIATVALRANHAPPVASTAASAPPSAASLPAPLPPEPARAPIAPSAALPAPEPLAPREVEPSVPARQPPAPQPGGASPHLAPAARPAASTTGRPPASPTQKGSAYEDM